MRAPEPAVNESHFLAKARHFVDPAWCQNDFFLASSNPHQVFYLLAGPLTLVAGFPAAAWIGRLLSLTLLATGWVALVRRLVPAPRSGWHATVLFLLFVGCGNFSGEWVIGGFEGKVLAYGLLLWAAATAIDGRLVAAALCGLAISVHPIVGGWALVCGVLAQLSRMIGPVVDPVLGQQPPAAVSWRLDRRWLSRAGLLVVCALPGVIPALGLLGESSYAADEIQVFTRLGHHLSPSRIWESSPTTVIVYALAPLILLVLRRPAVRSDVEAWWTRLVFASFLVALAGLVLAVEPPLPMSSLGHLRLTLMRFYPYRLFDLLLPAAAAVTVAGLLARIPRGSVREPIVFFTLAVALVLMLAAEDRFPRHLNAKRRSDWVKTCRFIDDQLPAEAVVFTPRGSWAFKWFAKRAEYVVFKDCPQDAAGILEWDRRLSFRDGFLLGSRRPEDLPRPTNRPTTEQAFPGSGVSHLLLRHDRLPLHLDGLELLYENSSFRVYAVSAAK